MLAYDLHAMFNYGNTPWTMLSLLGGSYRMRGYYEGRYRDKKMIEAQVELRQKVYGRSGIAVWIGAGQCLSIHSAVQLEAYAAELRYRLPLGVQEADERPIGLRVRQEGPERIFVQYQRGVLRAVCCPRAAGCRMSRLKTELNHVIR